MPISDSRPAGSREKLDSLQARAWEAFAHELAALLHASPGKWVAYRGQDRVCVGDSKPAVYEECRRRGLPADELLVELVYPAAVELPEVFLPPRRAAAGKPGLAARPGAATPFPLRADMEVIVPAHVVALPFGDTLRVLDVHGVRVSVFAYEPTVWVSVTRAEVNTLPADAPRFPAVVDTGNTVALNIREEHLTAWGVGRRGRPTCRWPPRPTAFTMPAVTSRSYHAGRPTSGFTPTPRTPACPR